MYVLFYFQPFLIDGFKYDMRIYVLVVSCDPLRIFVFKDGLARFATTKYIEPSHNNVVSFDIFFLPITHKQYDKMNDKKEANNII